MLPGEQPTGGRSLTGYFIGTAKLIDVTTRPRRADDVPACVQALAEVHRKDGYPTRWPKDPADWLDSPGLLGAWVAEGAGVMAGHIALVVGVDDAELIKAAGRPAVELAMVSALRQARHSRPTPRRSAGPHRDSIRVESRIRACA